MGLITGLITVISSLNSARRLRKAKKQIALTNEHEKDIAEAGLIATSQLFPINQWVGNALFSGGSIGERNDLIIQYCRQAVSLGNSVVVIHENNLDLKQKIENEFRNHTNARFIDDNNPYYEPFWKLSNSDLCALATGVGEKTSKIDTKGQRALKAIAELLRHKVGRPYIRMMATSPISQLNSVIRDLEDKGKISRNEAKEIRSDLDDGDVGSAVQFLEQLVRNTPFLAGKNQLNNSISILEAVKTHGIIVIDLQSSARQMALALMLSEMEESAIITQRASIVMDVGADYNDIILNCLYKLRLPWAVACSDVFQLSNGKKDTLKKWLSLSNRAILFNHPEISADAIATELGTYQKIEATETTTMNNSIGRFGFHHGDDKGLATKKTREQRIFSEDIKDLSDREFYLLDNNYSTICKGVLI